MDSDPPSKPFEPQALRERSLITSLLRKPRQDDAQAALGTLLAERRRGVSRESQRFAPTRLRSFWHLKPDRSLAEVWGKSTPEISPSGSSDQAAAQASYLRL